MHHVIHFTRLWKCTRVLKALGLTTEESIIYDSHHFPFQKRFIESHFYPMLCNWVGLIAKKVHPRLEGDQLEELCIDLNRCFRGKVDT